jgi:cytochrome c peroxidase
MVKFRCTRAAAIAFPAVCLVVWAGEKPPREPQGLPHIEWPKNNHYSEAKAELGRYLYFDKRLSADETISCATCHDPKFGFTDGQPVSTGINGQKGNRSAPTVINRAFSLVQFWDGRADSLEDQVKGPIANAIEMGNSHEMAMASVRESEGYRALFAKAFGSEEVTIDRAAMAIATFERTILSGNSPYDRYKKGDKHAMTPEQVRGMSVFVDKAKCDRCHENANFTLNAYSNIGVGMDKPDPDVGRYAITKDPRDWGVFKVPTLREIEHTAPYMHDGSLKTLEEVVDFYDKGGIPNKNLDGNIRKLNLTDQDKKDLVAFLKGLSGEGWQHAAPPAEFPK